MFLTMELLLWEKEEFRSEIQVRAIEASIEISQNDYASRQRAQKPPEIIDLVRIIRIIGLCGEGDCSGTG